MKQHLPGLIALTIGCAAALVPIAESAGAAPHHGAPSSVCSMTGEHELQILLPRGTRTTISREDGSVRVAGLRCVVGNGTPVQVRQLTDVKVKVRGDRTAVSTESVKLPDLDRWRTDHPADDRGPARVRMSVNLKGTDFVTGLGDLPGRFDRIVVMGTAAADRWSVAKRLHGATVSFDAGAEPDLVLSGAILVTRQGAGDDALDVAPADERGSWWTESQPLRAYTSAGDDTVTSASVYLQTLDLGSGDDRVRMSGSPAYDADAGKAEVRPGFGDDTVTATDTAEIALVSEAKPDGADSVVVPSATTNTSVIWSYEFRTAPVRVTADGVADDGAPGEGDNVPDTTRGLYGGAGDDTLDLSQVVFPGFDQPVYLMGGEGDDRLTTSRWTDMVSGNGGDDVITGPATDYTPSDITDDILGGFGDDRFLLRDGQLDDVRGGGGQDSAQLDAEDAAVDVEHVDRP